MKKLYLVLLIALGALLLGIGAYSVVNFIQKGAPLPQATLPKLMDGTYTAELEDAYTKQFPGREPLLSANRLLNRLYYFTPTEQNVLTVEYQGGAELGGERLQQPAQKPVAETPKPVQAPKPAPEPEPILPTVETPAEQDVTAVGTIIINGNRAMDIPTADNDIIRSYAAAVNRIAEKAGKDVRVFSLVTPNAGQFYSPESMHTGEHDQKTMIDLCHSALSGQVTPVDAYSAMAAHADEYLYFRTDHHWTQKGAYYAYTAFCKAAGFPCAPLDSYESGEYRNFVGSMYNYTSGYAQSEALKNQPDTLTYYLPRVETHARYYLDATMSEHYTIATVDTNLREEVTNKYLCFLCGDTPITVIDTAAEGGTCLVLKESYGNALVPFLTEHYSRVITVDPREFCAEGKPAIDLWKFMRLQRVDDVLIVNYPFMMNSKLYVSQLNNLIP